MIPNPDDRPRRVRRHCVGRTADRLRPRVDRETLVDDAMETRGARRKSQGLPRKAPAYAKTGGKKELTTKDGHWSGAKKGGARGDSFLANAGSTLFVLAIILTTPFIAVIVYVRSIAARGSRPKARPRIRPRLESIHDDDVRFSFSDAVRSFLIIIFSRPRVETTGGTRS